MQILTAKQHAIGIVHSYPWIPEKHRLLELLAFKRGDPTAEELTQSAGMDNLQHAANWQQIEEYLKTVTVHNMNKHIPLLKDPVAGSDVMPSFTEQLLDPLV